MAINQGKQDPSLPDGGGVYRKDKQGTPCPDFKNDLNKTTAFREERRKEKSLCNGVYRNAPGSSAFTATAVQELEGAKLCWENRASSWFAGRGLPSKRWAKLELGGCRVPGREETWPRSGSASSMLCDLGPYSDLSVLRFCK